MLGFPKDYLNKSPVQTKEQWIDGKGNLFTDHIISIQFSMDRVKVNLET